MKYVTPSAKRILLAPFGLFNTCNQNSERKPHSQSYRPTQSISLFALLFLVNIILFNFPAFAQDNRQETEKASEQPSEVVNKRWTGHLNYVIGYKKVNDDWAPAESQFEFGLIDCDIKRLNWPLQPAPGLFPNPAPAMEQPVWQVQRPQPMLMSLCLWMEITATIQGSWNSCSVLLSKAGPIW